jgi:lysophospholipase L1-like esterase
VDAERPQTDGFIRSLHSPRALLLGVTFSFLACCAAGEIVSRRNVFHDFQRFHTHIDPDSHYYPTVRQVRALARERGAGKTLVIVGGNSVLHGCGQPENELWTRRLQEHLGDDYRVLNLGMKGASPAEFGGVAAEILSREHQRVVFVTSLSSNGVALGEAEGRTYRYFFWEAYHRGLLRDQPDREKRLVALREKYKTDEAFAESQRQMRVDRLTSSRDLWSVVAYEGLSTVWSHHVRWSVLKPRKRYPDVDGFSLPANAPYVRIERETGIAYVRALAARHAEVPGDPPPWAADLLAAFPEPDRKRTLVLGIGDNPYCVSHLNSAELARYRAIIPSYVPQIERLGFSALDLSDGWAVDDFVDHVHLTAQGGHRLADLVAPKIRQMARELGYLNEGGEP